MKYSVKNEEMRISELSLKKGGIFSTENLYGSADGSLITRGRRALIRKLAQGDALMGDDTLAYVDDGRLYYGGLEINGLYLTAGEKTVHKIGSFLVIFPDEVFVNLGNYDDCGSLNSTYSTYGSAISIADINGNKISYSVVSELPAEAAEETYCMLKSKSGELSMNKMLKSGWQNTDAYIRIDAGGIGASFRAGDTVYASGLSNVIGRYFKITKKTTDWLLIEGLIEKSGFSTSSLKLSRVVPSFDFTTVSGGRLFGVRRGADKNGNLVCRMYGSAIGDPFNFAPEGGGVVMDLDINGLFTGICDYLGNPIAFTENEIIEARIKGEALIGTVIKGYGVERNSHKSIAQYGGVLYYKSNMGICAYDGSYPEVISASDSALAKRSESSRGAVWRGKYFVSVSSLDGEESLYVYDIKSKMWRRENPCGIKAFAECKGALYTLGGDTDGDFLMLMDFDGADITQRYYLADEGYPLVEEAFDWSLESDSIGADTLDFVCPVRVAVRMKKNGNEALEATVIYGDEKSYARVFAQEVNGTLEIPLPLRRCDSFRIKLSGKGEVKLTGLQVTYRVGGKARGWK